MKKTPPNQTASESAPSKAYPTTSSFIGTENPRHLRAIDALMTGSKRREQLDAIAGCSNGPQLVAELRRLGLDIPCTLVTDLDRDGRQIKRGVYHFTTSDHHKIVHWLRGTAEGESGVRDGA
jgi:hypothetical protein